LAKHKRVQLIWVPDDEDIDGNKMADQLAKLGSERQFIGPELACSISMGAAKKAVKDWIIRDHRKHRDSLIGLKTNKRYSYRDPLPTKQGTF
jgi:hypothetical protein